MADQWEEAAKQFRPSGNPSPAGELNNNDDWKLWQQNEPGQTEQKPGLLQQAKSFSQEYPRVTAAATMIPGIGPLIGAATDPTNELGKGMAKQLGRDVYGLATGPGAGPIGMGLGYLGEKTGIGPKINQMTEPNNPQQEVGGYGTMAAEAMLPLPKALEALPSKARAGRNFDIAMKAAANEPVEVSHFAQPVLRAKELNVRTGDTMPPIVRRAFGTIQPTTEPLTYEAARDMASAAGRKAVQQSMAPRVVSPPMTAQVSRLAKGLDTATQEAASRAGVGDIHAQAMKEYRNAARLEDVGQKLKKAAIAVGTGAGLYEAGRPIARKLMGGE